MGMPQILRAAEGEGAPEGIELFFPHLSELIWSIITFVIVFLVVWKFVLPRINKVLDERANLIEGGIKRAEAAQEEAAQARAEYQSLLNDARAEANSIREQARGEGASIIAEMREQAHAEADRIVANAKAQIEAEHQAALTSLRSEVGTLALGLASGVVGESLSDDARSTALVDRFLADLDADQKAGSTN